MTLSTKGAPVSLLCASRHLSLVSLFVLLSVLHLIRTPRGESLRPPSHLLPSVLHPSAQSTPLAKQDGTVFFSSWRLPLCSWLRFGHKDGTALSCLSGVSNFLPTLSLLAWKFRVHRHTPSLPCVSVPMESCVSSSLIRDTRLVSERHPWTSIFRKLLALYPSAGGVPTHASHFCLALCTRQWMGRIL